MIIIYLIYFWKVLYDCSKWPHSLFVGFRSPDALPWAARRAAQVCLEAHLRGFPHPNTYLRRWVCYAGNSNTEKWRLKWKYSSWNIVRYEFCWIRWKRNNWIHVVLVVKYVKKTPILGTSFNFFNFFLLCAPFVLCEPLTIYIWQLCGGKRVKI